ncbi:unnamed protein product, partial [Hapterophycus canaliculatus]
WDDSASHSQSKSHSKQLELEEADCLFFDRATTQYLTSGDRSSPHIKNMREALQVFGTSSADLERMVRHQSPFGHLKGWKLAHFIVKAGDDFRMEALAMQVIQLVDTIFKREGLSLRLRPYAILCCGDMKGLVECVTDAKSIDHIKKSTVKSGGIRTFFERMYMGKTSGLYGRAVDNFVRSLAGYAIVTYMLQAHRHNANIMLDTRGHIVHIDFGYILGSAPGWWNHESAPFKFTQDYMEIMGGPGSDKWERFRELFLTGFKAVQRHMREIEALIWPMFPSSDHRMATQQQILFRKRFMDFQTDDEIMRLVDDSVRSWTTGQYDDFQQKTNGYLK